MRLAGARSGLNTGLGASTGGQESGSTGLCGERGHEGTPEMSPWCPPIWPDEDRLMRLTATAMRSLICPDGKSEQTFFDDDLPGFGLRVRASGSKSWLYQYAIAGLTKKIFLGSPAVVDAGKARAAAKDLAAAVRLGRDPAAEKTKSRVEAAETFGALLPRFLDRQRERLKPRSFEETERHLQKHCRPLHASAVKALDRRAIAQRLEEIAKTSGPTAANRVRASLSAYFAWLARPGFVDSNVVSFTDKAHETGARERVLTDAELKAIWRAASDDSDYDEIIKLLMLTGCRRDEIGSLSWSEIDFDAATITLPPERTKNRRPHTVPLTPPAVAILEARRLKAAGGERGFVFGWGRGGFSGWSKGKAEFSARVVDPAGEPISDWTPHDFRRSLSTWLHERGVAPHIVESILGHVSGHKAGVAGVYNKALYLDERRRALARWGDHIIALAGGEPATAQVVKLR